MYANEVCPDYVGFVFADTRRKISHAQAADFRALLADEIPAVGVFVNAEIDEIRTLADAGSIDVIQLHGTEDAEYIDRLREVCDKPLIKAVKVQSAEDIRQAAKLPVSYLLLDTYKKGVAGGTGETFDWEMIGQARQLAGDEEPGYLFGKPFFLAGGLTPENLGAAAKLGSYGLDLSSGIETDGSKDVAKMRAAVEIVRTAR